GSGHRRSRQAACNSQAKAAQCPHVTALKKSRACMPFLKQTESSHATSRIANSRFSRLRLSEKIKGSCPKNLCLALNCECSGYSLQLHCACKSGKSNSGSFANNHVGDASSY